MITDYSWVREGGGWGCMGVGPGAAAQRMLKLGIFGATVALYLGTVETGSVYIMPYLIYIIEQQLINILNIMSCATGGCTPKNVSLLSFALLAHKI